MPKKTVSTRNGAQRNRPRVQKNIELVRKDATKQAPTTLDQSGVIIAESPEVASATEAAPPVTASSSALTNGASTKLTNVVAPAPNTTSTQRRRTGSSRASATPPAAERERSNSSNNITAPKGGVTAPTSAPKSGASARLAARRAAVQKVQQRAVSLITSEHYSYVRKDLRFIAILAAIMFAIIIILHFVPGIGS